MVLAKNINRQQSMQAETSNQLSAGGAAIAIKYRETNVSMNTTFELVKGWYICRDCNFKSCDRNTFVKHIQMHVGNIRARPNRCAHCAYGSSSADAVLQHCRTVHRIQGIKYLPAGKMLPIIILRKLTVAKEAHKKVSLGDALFVFGQLQPQKALRAIEKLGGKKEVVLDDVPIPQSSGVEGCEIPGVYAPGTSQSLSHNLSSQANRIIYQGQELHNREAQHNIRVPGVGVHVNYGHSDRANVWTSQASDSPGQVHHRGMVPYMSATSSMSAVPGQSWREGPPPQGAYSSSQLPVQVGRHQEPPPLHHHTPTHGSHTAQQQVFMSNVNGAGLPWVPQHTAAPVGTTTDPQGQAARMHTGSPNIVLQEFEGIARAHSSIPQQQFALGMHATSGQQSAQQMSATRDRQLAHQNRPVWHEPAQISPQSKPTHQVYCHSASESVNFQTDYLRNSSTRAQVPPNNFILPQGGVTRRPPRQSPILSGVSQLSLQQSSVPHAPGRVLLRSPQQSPVPAGVPQRSTEPSPVSGRVPQRSPQQHPVSGGVPQRSPQQSPVPGRVPQRSPRQSPVSGGVPQRSPQQSPVPGRVAQRSPRQSPVSGGVPQRSPQQSPVPGRVPQRSPGQSPVPGGVPQRNAPQRSPQQRLASVPSPQVGDVPVPMGHLSVVCGSMTRDQARNCTIPQYEPISPPFTAGTPSEMLSNSKDIALDFNRNKLGADMFTEIELEDFFQGVAFENGPEPIVIVPIEPPVKRLRTSSGTSEVASEKDASQCDDTGPQHVAGDREMSMAGNVMDPNMCQSMDLLNLQHIKLEHETRPRRSQPQYIEILEEEVTAGVANLSDDATVGIINQNYDATPGFVKQFDGATTGFVNQSEDIIGGVTSENNDATNQSDDVTVSITNQHDDATVGVTNQSSDATGSITNQNDDATVSVTNQSDDAMTGNIQHDDTTTDFAVQHNENSVDAGTVIATPMNDTSGIANQYNDATARIAIQNDNTRADIANQNEIHRANQNEINCANQNEINRESKDASVADSAEGSGVNICTGNAASLGVESDEGSSTEAFAHKVVAMGRCMFKNGAYRCCACGYKTSRQHKFCRHLWKELHKDTKNNCMHIHCSSVGRKFYECPIVKMWMSLLNRSKGIQSRNSAMGPSRAVTKSVQQDAITLNLTGSGAGRSHTSGDHLEASSMIQSGSSSEGSGENSASGEEESETVPDQYQNFNSVEDIPTNAIVCDKQGHNGDLALKGEATSIVVEIMEDVLDTVLMAKSHSPVMPSGLHGLQKTLNPATTYVEAPSEKTKNTSATAVAPSVEAKQNRIASSAELQLPSGSPPESPLDLSLPRLQHSSNHQQSCLPDLSALQISLREASSKPPLSPSPSPHERTSPAEISKNDLLVQSIPGSTCNGREEFTMLPEVEVPTESSKLNTAVSEKLKEESADAFAKQRVIGGQTENTSRDSVGQKDDHSQAGVDDLHGADGTVASGVWACDKCTFHCDISSASILRHQKYHLSPQDSAAPFRCLLCPFTTAALKDFRLHMQGHTGHHVLRTYECSHCDLVTGQLDHIETHLDIDHPRHTFHYVVSQVQEICKYSV